MKSCRRCLLPAAVPGADLDADADGVCAFCRQHDRADRSREESLRREWEADLEKALAGCRGRGRGGYDCLVCFSGGKDSCYLLHKLAVERRLRVLAFTVNINVPEVAWDNIRRTIARLDVDHLVYTPPQEFYLRMFRHLLKNQEARGAVRTVCYACAPLTESYALQVATEKGIPLVLAGYSPGQPDADRMTYEFAPWMIRELDWTPPELRRSGLFPEAELSRFWNPRRYPAGTSFPRFLAPFHAWKYSQAEVMKAVVKLGLIRNGKHASPVHSNCPVNWLLMYSDLQNLGYNSYAPEFCRLIREGRASRRYWSVMQPVVNWMIRSRLLLGRNVTRSLRILGLAPEELRITRRAEPPPEPPASRGGSRPPEAGTEAEEPCCAHCGAGDGR